MITLGLLLSAAAGVQDMKLEVDGRSVHVRVAHPACRHGERKPLLIFSHGANSAPAKYDRLTRAWAERGFLVAAPLHADSPDHPGGGKVTQAQSWDFRVADMRALLDRADKVTSVAGCRPDPSRVAATGHSYGALIAQVLGGARKVGGPDQRDSRVKAVVAFSPPGPIPGYMAPEGWDSLAVPMFVQTGTADVLPMIAPSWEAHRVSFDRQWGEPALLFVGKDVDHYFGNIIGRPERTRAPATAAFAEAVNLSIRFLELAFVVAPPQRYVGLLAEQPSGSTVELYTPE